MESFRQVLVANRGEIAIRVMRTCKEMGIDTVAVYSEADREARHVAFADEAVCIGPAPSTDSYLAGERIIEAAVRLEVDAIHPGYGFLAENADFAAACASAGLVFIGPTPGAIRLMGSKIEARKTMEAHGVPVIPGYHGDDRSDEALERAALDVGFPVLIKASAGGGGKGMRVARDPDELEAALAAARSEAENAFGDGTLLLERYIDRPRHVEFQIFGDTHGTIVHLFERECSIQRRYQKVIEETPSTALTPELRAAMADAAVAAGKAIGYVNAGTVEFILDQDGRFYFLEVNTRLQVEHPVTEMVTGLDLVRLQIEVAEGRPLALSQADIVSRGHAVEARVYAEDPSAGFLPSTGTIREWIIPESHGVRVDAGFGKGSEVGVHYDPLLAKVVAWGTTREEATRKLARTLKQAAIHGVTTNCSFLVDVLEHPAYRRGEIDTHFIDRHLDLEPPAEVVPGLDDLEALAAVVLHGHLERRRSFPHLRALPPGFRNNRYRDQEVSLEVLGSRVEVTYRWVEEGRYRVVAGPAPMDVRVVHFEPGQVRLEINGTLRRFRVTAGGDVVHVTGPRGTLRVTVVPDFPEHDDEAAPGTSVAPMPGRVLEVLVEEGQAVEAGAPLVTMEAMKMQHTLQAPFDGVVTTVFVRAGELVDAGARLVLVETRAPSE